MENDERVMGCLCVNRIKVHYLGVCERVGTKPIILYNSYMLVKGKRKGDVRFPKDTVK